MLSRGKWEAVVEPALARTLFTGRDAVVVSGTPDYDDFLVFVKKYFSFAEVRAERQLLAAASGAPSAPRAPPDDAASIVAEEQRRVSDMNFTVAFERPVALDGVLSRGEWAAVERLVHFYVDYRVKRPFAALRALHDSRRTLPIGAYEEAIVDAVRGNQVVIVSGDTGCGKSTQVLCPAGPLSPQLPCIAC